jgi:hypothetical protein
VVAAGLDLHPRQRRSRRRLQGEGDAFESALADVFRREHRQVGMLEKEVRGVNDGKHRAAAEVGPFAPAGRRAPPDHRERARIRRLRGAAQFERGGREPVRLALRHRERIAVGARRMAVPKPIDPQRQEILQLAADRSFSSAGSVSSPRLSETGAAAKRRCAPVGPSRARATRTAPRWQPNP